MIHKNNYVKKILNDDLNLKEIIIHINKQYKINYELSDLLKMYLKSKIENHILFDFILF